MLASVEFLPPNPISTTLDFEYDGIQHGFLKLPYSHDDSAWGAIMIPITVIRNGEGETALLTGGNHGDEYEGPVSLFKLANTLAAEDIRGRVIILPAMNYPAFNAARRTSPIDGGNLNRMFPGRPDGSTTQKIADYFQRYLLPMADYVLDIHSGGKTLEFVPFAACHILPDKEQEDRCRAAMEAFSAPYSMQMLEMDSRGMYDTAAEALGKVFVTTELGGGGTASARNVHIADRGVRNFLKHAGVLEGVPERAESVKLDMPGDECFISSEDDGLLEPCVDLGDTVHEGDVIARVHNIRRTGIPPRDYYATMDGLLVARHFPGIVRGGDCISVLATWW